MGRDRLDWVAMSGGAHPPDSVHAGVDSNETVYVARAHHEGNLVPGKLMNTHSHVYIPYNMTEVSVPNYEVLTAPPAALSWVPGSNGEVHEHAVPGGYDGGEPTFIGRVIHNGTVTVGKIHPSHGCCYIAYGGEEHNYTEYEILVRNKFGQFMGV